MGGKTYRVVQTSHERFAVQEKIVLWWWKSISYYDNEQPAIAEAQARELHKSKEAAEKVISVVWPHDYGWL